MKTFKLSALALASILALTGCGSDSSSTIIPPNNSLPTPPPKPPVNNKIPELDQAKNIINTAKQFILDGNAISDAYKGASDILTAKQEARIDSTFEVAYQLADYMKQTNKSKLTAADITVLKDDGQFNSILEGIKLNPSNDFVAMRNANGEFTLSGTTSISTETYGWVDDGRWGSWGVVDTDQFTVNYDSFKDALVSNTPSTDFKGSFGFKKLNIGINDNPVVLSSASNGATVFGKFSDKVTVDDEFNLNDIHNSGVTIQRAVMELGEVKLQANDSTIQAKNVELGFLEMSHKLADGELVVVTLPTTVIIQGAFVKGKPATNATITLNARANESDIKQIVQVAADGNLKEAAGKFVGMDVVLALKGNVSKQNADASVKTIPLDFQANIKRIARDVIELQGLKAVVDGQNLYVAGKTTLSADYQVTRSMLEISQNQAEIVLNLDADGKFIKVNSATGKFADIKVNGKVFGELLENNGTISAKFNDGKFVVLAS